MRVFRVDVYVAGPDKQLIMNCGNVVGEFTTGRQKISRVTAAVMAESPYEATQKTVEHIDLGTDFFIFDTKAEELSDFSFCIESKSTEE